MRVRVAAVKLELVAVGQRTKLYFVCDGDSKRFGELLNLGSI